MLPKIFVAAGGTPTDGEQMFLRRRVVARAMVEWSAAQWALVGGLGLVSGLAAWATGAFVYAAAPFRTQNRLAALFLALLGFQMVAGQGIQPLFYHFDNGSVEAVAFVAAISQSFVYLALVGTLDSPLARPFRSAAARATLLTLAALSIVLWPLYHRSIIMQGAPRVAGLSWGEGPLYYPAFLFHGIVLLFGFLVALSAWRRAPHGSATRSRSRAFAAAFGVRDIVFFGFTTWAFLTSGIYSEISVTPFLIAVGFAWNVLVGASVLAMVLLMGYGMAKAQLFEVDIQVKAGVRRGAIAGAFLATFLVVSQLVQGASTETFGLVGGALASGLLLFALAPLQRAAERLSGAVVPDARPLAERASAERAELYREQVRIAWEDGKLGLKERRMLDAARERLGLAADVAVALENEVTRVPA